MTAAQQAGPAPGSASSATTRPTRTELAPPADGARAYLRRADPVLRRLIDAEPDFDPRAWLTDLPAMDLFGALVFQVIGQQLSLSATRAILTRLMARFGGGPPSARQLAHLRPEVLRSFGLSRRKAATLTDLARRFEEGTLDEATLREQPDEAVVDALCAVPGIGPWTAQGALVIAFGREDVVLPGDLALRKAVQAAYGLERLPEPEEVLAVAEAWRPHRTLATSYLFASHYRREPGR